jgi:murein tripeptide amidase MpaA
VWECIRAWPSSRGFPNPNQAPTAEVSLQWYHFRASGGQGRECVFRLTNAGGASYGDAWSGYCSAASYDRKHWFRVPTAYDEATGELAIAHTPEANVCYYAVRTHPTLHYCTASTARRRDTLECSCCSEGGLL